MKYHTESIFTGIIILAIGLTFNGFSAQPIEPAEAHQSETIRLQAARTPIVIPEAVVVEKRVYKKSEQMDPQDLKSLLYEVGFRGAKLREAWGTAMKESTGRPMSHNKNSNTGDNSYGLFQINMIGSLGPARLEKYGLESNKDLFDPLTNAKIAFQMSNGGKDWSSWHGITDKTKQWMKEFPN